MAKQPDKPWGIPDYLAAMFLAFVLVSLLVIYAPNLVPW
jgi:hypothetical protein